MPCYIPVSRRRWWLWVSFSTWFQHSCRPSNLLFWCHLDFRTLCNKKWMRVEMMVARSIPTNIPSSKLSHPCLYIYLYIRTSHFSRYILYQYIPSSQPSVKPCTDLRFCIKPKAAATCQRGGESEWWNAWFARQIVERQRSLRCWWWEWFGGELVGESCASFFGKGEGVGALRIRGHGQQHTSLLCWRCFFSAEMRQWRYWLVIFEDICWVEDMMRWKPSSRHQFNVIPWTLIARSMVLHVVPLFCFARPFLDFFWSPKALRFWLSIEV